MKIILSQTLNLNRIQRDGEWIEIARELALLQQNIKQMEEVEDELKNRLKMLSDGQTSFGGGFLFKKSTRAGTVNYKLIPELQEVDLDYYRSAETEVWKLSLEVQ